MMIKYVLALIAMMTACVPALADPVGEFEPPQPVQITFDFGAMIDQPGSQPYDEKQGLSGYAMFVFGGWDGTFGLGDLMYADMYGQGYVAGQWINPARTYGAFSATVSNGVLTAFSFSTSGDGFAASLASLKDPVVMSYNGQSYEGTFSLSGIAYDPDAPATASPAPETATWAMMIAGFGAIGTAMRRRRKLALA